MALATNQSLHAQRNDDAKEKEWWDDCEPKVCLCPKSVVLLILKRGRLRELGRSVR